MGLKHVVQPKVKLSALDLLVPSLFVLGNRCTSSASSGTVLVPRESFYQAQALEDELAQPQRAMEEKHDLDDASASSQADAKDSGGEWRQIRSGRNGRHTSVEFACTHWASYCASEYEVPVLLAEMAASCMGLYGVSLALLESWTVFSAHLDGV